MPMRQASFRLPDDVFAWLKAQSEENVRSMASEVVVLVRAEMARRVQTQPRKSKAGPSRD